MTLAVSYACLAVAQILQRLGAYHKHWIVLAIVISFLLTFLWMSILAFDIMWTFCRFRSEILSENLTRFKFYCVYVSVVVGAAVLPFFFPFQYFRLIHLGLLISFVVMAILDVIFMLVAGFKIFQISRSSNQSENFRFKQETAR
jgi:hypothetical protein